MKIENAVCYSFSLNVEDPMSHFRLTAPLRQAGINIVQGIENNQIFVDRVSEGDMVIIQREFPKQFDSYEKIIEIARQEEKPVVFDLDDLLFYLPENHPDRQSAEFGPSLLPMFQALMEADLVSVATPQLRDFVINYNDNVAVLPNYFDDNLWQLKPPVLKTSEQETLTIGYMGGDSHRPDLESITPVLLDLIKRYPHKLRFHFWGVQPPAEIASLPQVQWSPITTYIYKDFAAFFQTQTADIFIAPLMDNLFNRCKSPIKFFEYSALGAPGVFSRIETYADAVTHGHNGLLAASLDEWTDCLIQLIEDKELRFSVAKNAQETIQSNWLLSQNAFRWNEAFQSAFDIRSSKQNGHTVSIVESINLQLFDALNKKNAAVRTLRAQLAEKELPSQAAKIDDSKPWKMRIASLFHQIRVWIASPNRLRARRLPPLKKGTFSLFRKIRRNLKLKEDLELIRSSGLFDRDWYLTNNPDVAQAKVDPLLHYLNSGGFEGRDPGPNFSSVWYLGTYADVKKAGSNPLVHYLRFGRQAGRSTQSAQTKQNLNPVNSPDLFDPDWYLTRNPDVAQAGVDPYQHYQQYGKFEGRLGHRPNIKIQPGGVQFEPSKDTVLVVSHEASRTGAPILSLNIVQILQKKYNVVSFFLGGGSISEYLRDASTFVVGPIPSRNPFIAAYMIDQLAELHKFKFAIVNSIESRAVLPALARWFIPTVSLIHEFAAYIRPREAFLEAILWSNEVIFSAALTHENAVSEFPELENHPFHILPQGHSVLPFAEGDTVSLAKEELRVIRALRPEGLPADTVVVLGVGTVFIRKGVDLFLDCAAKVIEAAHGKNFRFVWIGKGYDPEMETNYSVYLADQIHRSGLQEHAFFLEETSSIEVAYKAADMLLISSRLDPLPNTAIDAMMLGLPLVCFEKTTGIADILIANGLGESCVAPYLDTLKMAEKVMAFAQSKSLSQKVGEQLRQVALKEFDMENYVSQLEQIGLTLHDRIAQEQTDVKEIINSGLARLDFFSPSLNMSPDEAIQYYVRKWASGIGRRKLFPGFHPGIFMEQHKLHKSDGDPLANYLRAGKPMGPWRYDVITSQEIAQPLQPDVRIALHLHVYYPDMLPEILQRLNGNQIRPDLFISVPTESARYEVQSVLSQSYSGKVIEIQVVPNSGRDIGPFLTAFGAVFVDQYDVVGHFHTKKSPHANDKIGKDWYDFLLENLLGGKGNMADIAIRHLTTDPSIGLIFPDDPNILDWGLNRSYAEALGQQLGLNNLPENLLFPVGTMFWAKVEALLPIFDLGLNWQDYPIEPLPIDGTILHALERLLPLVSSSRGFRSALTNVTGITR